MYLKLSNFLFKFCDFCDFQFFFFLFYFLVYSSLKIIGQPKKGETIFISAAAGAVGQLVGQMAKHQGLRVIGSVGSDDKVDYLINELKFDAAFNYKKGNILENLKRLAPEGIDM